VLTNMPVAIEQHVDWIADCIEHMRAHAKNRIEPTDQAQAAWVEHVAEVAKYRSGRVPVRGAIPGKPRVVMSHGRATDVSRALQVVTKAGYAGFELRDP
jgi:cyclohexanone monooxygenase